MNQHWAHRRGELDLGTPRIMGIVNATPDSFSDGGQFDDSDAAIDHALKLLQAGADIVDIGGESTRPGAEAVSAEEELRRVIPVIRGIRERSEALISIDTTKVKVARAALDAGADIINDVSAFTFEPAMAQLAASSGAGVCLMHTPGRPDEMQELATYEDVVLEVRAHLQARVAVAREAGIADAAIVIDPGFGFGKTKEQNYELLSSASRLTNMGFPVLIGLSRKRMIRDAVGKAPKSIEHGTTAANVIAMLSGVCLLRVHDVVAADAARGVFSSLPKTRDSDG